MTGCEGVTLGTVAGGNRGAGWLRLRGVTVALGGGRVR